ncbi:MAG: hypothetical protein K0U38_05145 [Epsilonproteobacteria bacterium]|nr:hypothetical protein [Campylobacterota bacterium]
MKKLMLISMLFTIFLEAKTTEVNYKVEFGIIGEIGIANAKLIQNENSYEIDIKLNATGIAKTLSGGREERHISKGHMKDGVMVSDLYQVMKSHGSKVSNKIYTIDHKNRVVTKIEKRWKNGKVTKDKNSTIADIYAEDDLLTLYFNLNSYIKDKTLSKDYRFHAVGAEKQDGYVDVHIPTSNELVEFKETLGSDGAWYAGAIINQDIFSSEKGELLLSVGKDGITEKAVLKDLVFFGDIRAKRL